MLVGVDPDNDARAVARARRVGATFTAGEAWDPKRPCGS